MLNSILIVSGAPICVIFQKLVTIIMILYSKTDISIQNCPLWISESRLILLAGSVYNMQDRSLSVANIFAKMPKIVNKFPAAAVIQWQATPVKLNVHWNWMMHGGISDSILCQECTNIILRNRLVLHVSVVVFILHHKLSHMIF